ncbi:MAG: 5,10-methylene-tetrahydrofolate dehydrogenase [Candidatus Parcubacteria bacterium]|jgi:methylenetetrahydrofolate dehydrogenase (NADP+)/methenyltetrahydrofolate cyclohydrolase
MQTQIIDGRKIRDEILEDVKKEIASLSFKPIFCDVLVGEDPASVQYVNMKKKTSTSVGIDFYDAHFPETITSGELIEEIIKINKIPNMSGVIVQLPLPGHLNIKDILDTIDPRLDVDCLSAVSTENFYKNNTDLVYPTALACVHILDLLNLDLGTKKIVVLGQGRLVGRPVAHLLKSRGLSVSCVDSKTENVSDLIKEADVIISAIGKGNFIKGDMIKEGVVLIDAGTSEEYGSIVGDIDRESVMGVASFVTSTPGGVGPVTISMLLRNILKVAQN